jgi:outer membrane protein OmpA-like peptidoglycan-associated protein
VHAVSENTSKACQDGKDNDADDFTDCADQDCGIFVFCAQPTSGYPESIAPTPTPTPSPSPTPSPTPTPSPEPVTKKEPSSGIQIDIEAKGDAKKLVKAINKYLDKQAEELSKVADVERTDEGVKVQMKSEILFDFNSYILKDVAKADLKALADKLNEYPENVIVVNGHTDSTGDDAYNQVLSENRAKAVADYLVSLGIAESGISYVGYGESLPIASNDTPEGQARNRRVELDITVDVKKFQETHPEPEVEVESCPPCKQPDPRRYTDKGVKEFNGTIYLNATINKNDYTNFTLLIEPGFYGFVMKGLRIGGSLLFRLDYNVLKEEGLEGEIDLYFIGGGLGFNIGYFIDLGSFVFPYADAHLRGLFGTVNSYEIDGYSFFIFSPGLELGLKFEIIKHGLLSVGLSYSYDMLRNLADKTWDGEHVIYLGTGLGFWF